MLAIDADVSDAGAVKLAMTARMKRFGRIDILMRAAAISIGRRLGDTEPDSGIKRVHRTRSTMARRSRWCRQHLGKPT